MLTTFGREQGTDIHVAPALAAGASRRVTIGRGSENMNPTFSPDGRKIAFVSGRLGHPEVYITDADGTNLELLTQFNVGEQAYRTSPDWSPDGRAIAYHAQIGGIFQLYTIGLRERLPRQLGARRVAESCRDAYTSCVPSGLSLIPRGRLPTGIVASTRREASARNLSTP